MSVLGIVLVVLLVILLVGGLPTWGYNRGWGYGPSGILFVLLIVIVILLAMGKL